jgi:hypothetical protein
LSRQTLLHLAPFWVKKMHCFCVDGSRSLNDMKKEISGWKPILKKLKEAWLICLLSALNVTLVLVIQYESCVCWAR